MKWEIRSIIIMWLLNAAYAVYSENYVAAFAFLYICIIWHDSYRCSSLKNNIEKESGKRKPPPKKP